VEGLFAMVGALPLPDEADFVLDVVVLDVVLAPDFGAAVDFAADPVFVPAEGLAVE
jgi:hypothetical protein